MELVVDKSFLDGASRERIREIREMYYVIMPEVLFFELITAREDSRRRCFAKLSDVDNPMALLEGIGDLLSYEIGAKRSCSPLSERCLRQAYRFNTRLGEGTFQFTGEVLQEIDEQKAQIESDTRNFVGRFLTVNQLFPELNGIERNELPNAVKAARKRAASDTDFIKKTYASFLNEQNSNCGWPSPDLIGENWAFFRWVQCQLIASLRLFERYQGNLPPSPGKGFWTKAEHSMIDTYYLIFATLGGGLASADKALIEDFTLVCPNGIVITPKWAAGDGGNRKGVE